MVLSYYFLKYPYKLLWRLKRLFGKPCKVAVYIADPMDYIVLQPVLFHLPPVTFVAKNAKSIKYLKSKGIDDIRRFCFPDAVIMCRHSTHKFPEERILKVGFRHGAYHFKAFAKSRYYNSFDMYFMTSQHEVDQAIDLGIDSARSIGFPKLDPAFNGKLDESKLDTCRRKAGIDNSKKTIIFSSTWDGSGMSAIDKWVSRLDEFTIKYNVIVTLHHWVSQKYIRMISSNSEVYLVDDPDVLPWLMIADLMVADMSSIIAEFCALDKPIVTFKISHGDRIVPEVVEIVSKISTQVNEVYELNDAIDHALENPDEKTTERKEANSRMFDSLDGKAGLRASKILKDLILELR